MKRNNSHRHSGNSNPNIYYSIVGRVCNNSFFYKSIVFVFIVFCFIPVSLSSQNESSANPDGIITEKLDEQLNPDSSDISVCYSWIARHTGKESYSVINRIIELEKSPGKILSVLKDHISDILESEQKGFVLKRKAEIESLTGFLEQAQKDYSEASTYLTDKSKYECLLCSARLAFEFGMIDECQRLIAEILKSSKYNEINNQAMSLALNIYVKNNKIATPFDYIEKEKKEYGDSIVTPGLLFIAFEYCTQQGNFEEIKKILGLLAEKYKKSPEYSCASVNKKAQNSEKIIRFPSPSSILSDTPLTPDIEKTDGKSGNDKIIQSDRETTMKDSFLIQMGCFKEKDNALCSVEELIKKGFESRIVEKEKGNNLYYAVVVIPPESAKPEEFLSKLTHLGFDGFIVHQ
jgi:hypothetical protein